MCSIGRSVALSANCVATVEQVTRDMDNGRPVNVEMFVLVRDLLREGLLPQALREALYRVAALIPGVEVTPGVTDQLGRAATAVWLVEDDTDSREQFLIDPETGAPVAERSLAPTVRSATRAPSSSGVPSTASTPAPDGTTRNDGHVRAWGLPTRGRALRGRDPQSGM